MSVTNIELQKQELRRALIQARKGMNKSDKSQLDKIFTQEFLSLVEYKNCTTLFTYVSTEFEIDTFSIINAALKDGKLVAVPKCRDKSGNMDFYYIDSLDCLKVGAFSILEPDEELCRKVSVFFRGLCLVPGLCFDLEGFRLGYGKGYYDRFLAKFSGISVGLCYSAFIQQHVPVDVYDKRVDILITDANINYTKLC